MCWANYGYLHWADDRHASTGYFFDSDTGGTWAKNIWANELRDGPYGEDVRQDMLAWRNARSRLPEGDAKNRMLDSMTYKELLEREFGLSPHGVRYADVFMANSFGLGCDAVSAYAASIAFMPGTASDDTVRAMEAASRDPVNRRHSFPGGNSGFARYFLKNLIPGASRSVIRNWKDCSTGDPPRITGAAPWSCCWT